MNVKSCNTNQAAQFVNLLHHSRYSRHVMEPVGLLPYSQPATWPTRFFKIHSNALLLTRPSALLPKRFPTNWLHTFLVPHAHHIPTPSTSI